MLVHGWVERSTERACHHPHMPPGGQKGPNPFLFLGLIVASFGSFALITKYRANTQPLSQSSRRSENPRAPLTASSREELNSKH